MNYQFNGLVNGLAKIFIVLVFLLQIISCEKDDMQVVPTDLKLVEREIDSSIGGILETSEKVKLVIPPGALTENGEVIIGRSYEEPRDIPNANFSLAVDPITLKLPGNSIDKTIQLAIPIPTNFDLETSHAVAFNGISYFPMEFTLESESLLIDIDIINWDEEVPDGRKNDSGRIIIYWLKSKQTPSENIGLKEVVVNSDGGYGFFKPSDDDDGEAILLIHGWIGNEKTWCSMIERLLKEENQQCKRILTFTYNSGHPIETNERNLYESLKEVVGLNNIEIVAHSMGGLVARSMLENDNNASVNNRIEKLITLGTPHNGSPLAAIRYIIGALIISEDVFLEHGISNDLSIYNTNSQGLRDMLPISKFISDLKKNNLEQEKYYCVAGISVSPISTFFESKFLLLGPDDVGVTVSSALGVDIAEEHKYSRIVLGWIPHIKLPTDENIYNKVLEYLSKCPEDNGMELIAYYPFNGEALDESGFHNDGDVIGTPNFVTGKFDGCIEFNNKSGTSPQWVSIVGSEKLLELESTSFVIDYYFNSTDASGLGGRLIVSDHVNHLDAFNSHYHSYASNMPKWEIPKYALPNNRQNNGTLLAYITDGKWHHIIFEVNRYEKYMKVTIDDYSETLNISDFPEKITWGNFALGYHPMNAGYGANKTKIDELKFYKF